MTEQFSKQVKRRIVEKLSEVATKRDLTAAAKRDPTLMMFGVCYLITRLTKNTVSGSTVVERYVSTWPYFTDRRSKFYPVPGGARAYNQGLDNRTLWKGRQGMYRRSLIRHLIKELKKEL